ncbi:hypothetical protein C4579_02950 [Candidatus Microgenomates bacterium]|nr:MAG: hypothetical protein C4579_02950 [Candidatus Microgenomates bacterium]
MKTAKKNTARLLALSKLNIFEYFTRVSEITVLKWVIGISLIVSVVSWFITYSQSLVLVYNDAMSHLNIARMVIDNIQPGLVQLGGVWLPVPHLFSLTLVWSDWAYYSGFAASFYSMLGFVATVASLYLAVVLLTKSIPAGIIAAFVVLLNANMLYLQSTPLTEVTYVALFSLSVLTFVYFLKTQNSMFLLPLGFLGFLQVLTRYDGWMVCGITALLILLTVRFDERKSWHESFGKCLLFLLPVLFGITIWLFWNLLIFDNPLYFALGTHSAHAQQTAIDESIGLITKNNLTTSLKAYFLTVLHNMGIGTVILGIFGIGLLFVQQKFPLTFLRKVMLFSLLLSPFLFNVIALFLGFSIINVPDLGWNFSQSADSSSQWFNIRYGIVSLPLIAFGVGFLSFRRSKAVMLLILLVVVLQFGTMLTTGVSTLTDGLSGASSYKDSRLVHLLTKDVAPQDTVLLSIQFFSPVAFKSGLPLKQYMHEGVYKVWDQALLYPDRFAQWVVMANNDVGEPVYTALIKNQHETFEQYYELTYQDSTARLYKLKNQNLTHN